MKSLLTKSNAKRRWLMAVVLLAAAACQGGTEGDQGHTPGDPNNTPPPPIGSATVITDQTTIPADGTTLVTARATLTDARGIARAGAPVVFTADLADVTWVTTDSEDPTNLYPTTCLAYTGNDGSAECVFRSGFTPGRSFVNASGPANLGLGASTEVQFTFAETFAGVTLSILTCPDSVDSGDLPAKKQIAVQALRPGQPGAGDTVPAEDVRVYYTSTVGIFDRTLQNHTTDATDNTGVSDQFLRIDSDEDGKFVNVVMTVAGSVPLLCQFTVGNFTAETTLELTHTPDSIRPDGSAQEITLLAKLSDTAGGSASPRIDHQIKFVTPVGVVVPNPLTLRAGGTGAGSATLQLSGAETRTLVDGQTVTVAASDDVSRAQASTDIAVTTEDTTVEVVSVDVTIPTPAPFSIDVRIKAQVTGAAGNVAGRSVSFDFGDGQPNEIDLTDATGIAEVLHTYIQPVDGDKFVITAVDLASNVAGTGTVTFAGEPEETVTVVVANLTVPVAAVPTTKTVLLTANVTVTGGTGIAGGRSVIFDFGDGTATAATVTNAVGVATASHQYDVPADGQSYTVTAGDAGSGATGSGTILFQVAGP